eukprot:1808542-Amphidinium_carterae.1
MSGIECDHTGFTWHSRFGYYSCGLGVKAWPHLSTGCPLQGWDDGKGKGKGKMGKMGKALTQSVVKCMELDTLPSRRSAASVRRTKIHSCKQTAQDLFVLQGGSDRKSFVSRECVTLIQLRSADSLFVFCCGLRRTEKVAGEQRMEAARALCCLQTGDVLILHICWQFSSREVLSFSVAHLGSRAR